MTKRDDARHRARYTLEFKLEAVRLVKAGQEASVTARVLGMPKAPCSTPFSEARTQLLKVASGIPKTRAVTEASWPAFTSRTASSLNSSVYRARCFASSFLVVKHSP